MARPNQDDVVKLLQQLAEQVRREQVTVENIDWHNEVVELLVEDGAPLDSYQHYRPSGRFSIQLELKRNLTAAETPR